MYCPNCRSEYRAGFEWCKDCDVGLVTDLPPEEESEFVDLVEVLSIADPGQIALVKSILEGKKYLICPKAKILTWDET